MKRLLLNPTFYAGMVVATIVCVRPSVGQTNVFFQPAEVADWNVDANWDDGAGNMFVPSADFEEVAVINNADSVAQISSGATPSPVGFAVGPGAVEILSSGSLSVVASAVTTGTSTVNGNGRLAVASGGSLTTDNQLNVNGTLELGSNASVTANGSLRFGGGSNFNVTLDSASFNPVSTPGAATIIGGNVNLDFAYTPAPGDSWDIIDAGSIIGNTPTITSSGSFTPEVWQRFALTTNAGGTNGAVGTVQLEDRVVLTIDRATGVGSITNLSPNPLDLDAYVIESPLGGVSVAGFNGFSAQGSDGGAWGEFGVQSANAIGELRAEGITALGAGESREIGVVFDPVATELGTDLEDLSFSYSNPTGDSIGGVVLYEGNRKFNNLVLNVDPNTGEAVLVNESELTFSFDGYAITSESGSLLTDGWTSLESDGRAGGDWFEIGSDANTIGELKATAETVLNQGDSFSLGAIFDTAGEMDLELEFVFGGESPTPFAGVVSFEDLVSVAGDYNGDGVVNAADYTVFRDNLGLDASAFADGTRDPSLSGPVSQDDYDFWVANFGAAGATAVPEPTGVLLALVAGVAMATTARRS